MYKTVYTNQEKANAAKSPVYIGKRKVGRVVDCTGLEIRRAGNGIVSSNLTPSANPAGTATTARRRAARR